MTEAELLKRLLIAISNIGSRIFRNHVGQAWQSSRVVLVPRRMTVDVEPGDVVLRQARRVQAGLCVGSSDLVGWTPHEIQPVDVGRRVAIFTAAECKSQSGRLTPEQRNFLAAVQRAGGIAVEARDVEEAVAAINQQRTRGHVE